MFWQSCSGKIYHPCTIRLCDVMGVGCVTCVTWSDITRDIPWHHLLLPSHPSFPRMKLYSCSLSLIRIFTLWLSQNDINQIQHNVSVIENMSTVSPKILYMCECVQQYLGLFYISNPPTHVLLDFDTWGHTFLVSLSVWIFTCGW